MVDQWVSAGHYQMGLRNDGVVVWRWSPYH
jgi:hypothetical protein